MKTNIEYKIYCDQDGVLADFDRQFIKLSGMTPKVYENKYGISKFWELISEEGISFWSTIKWMEDGEKLWKYIKKYNPSILTAPSRENESKLGKIIWIHKHIGYNEIIFSPANNKCDYASPTSILIDDKKSTVDSWNNRGGIGIIHISANDTIKQLKKLGL